MTRTAARCVEATRRRGLWIAGAGVACMAVGAWVGHSAGYCRATVELLGPAEAAAPRLEGSLISSDDLREKLARSGLEPDHHRLQTRPTPGGVRIEVESRDEERAVALANLYGKELAAAAAAFSRQRHEATRRSVAGRLARVDEELNQVSSALAEFQERTRGIDFDEGWAGPIRVRAEVQQRIQETRGKLEACELQIQGLSREIAKLTPALVAAKEELTEALKDFTEEHPKVKGLRSAIASLEAQSVARGPDDPALETINTPSVVALYTRLMELQGERAGLVNRLESLLVEQPRLQDQIDNLPLNQSLQVRLRSDFEALKNERFEMAQRLQQTEHRDGPAPLEIISRASPQFVDHSGKRRAAAWAGVGCALAGLAVAMFVVAVGPPGRIRSTHDLVHATGLPLLASLGELEHMSEAERQEWACRMFTLLRGCLTVNNADALVAGFTSSTHGEGRSTWIGLLADAAGRLGYRVVKVSAVCRNEQAPIEKPPLTFKDTTQLALAEHVRHEVAALPATTAWDSEYRDQWGQAVEEWQSIKRLVVLVELPPASQPEALLLSEALPNVIWLANQTTAHGQDIRRQVQTLRHARARLAGCVLNRAAGRFHRRRAMATALAFCSLLPLSLAQAQETAAPGEQPVAQAGLFVSAPNRLADWQTRLTLGPGDTFDISLFEQPESLRTDVVVGPDGRINYREARDVMAAGLTVDELRAKLEEILAQFHRVPRVIIAPQTYASKKYYLLGHVTQKGVFPLDRPTSVIEAIARAGGFVTTAQNRNSWIQADLARSFIVRRGSDGTFGRLPVDFEQLFLHGDLAQNFSLAPDDYLFFPPLNLQEVYVLGEVLTRGIVAYTPGLTAIEAIAAQGGFTERAFKSRVLIVRGSLSHPQTVILNASDVTKGKGLDVALKNRDIVYVHERPWATAEELLELAVISFAHAAVVGYAGQNIGPFIEEPIFK